MATNFEAKLADLPSFGTLAFRNGLKYRNADGHFSIVVNWPTSCKTLVLFSLAIPEIMWFMCVPV